MIVSIAIEFKISFMDIYEERVRIIVDRIRKIRENQNKSQLKVANDAGISQSFYGTIEAHKKKPSLETVLKIASALEIEPSRLFVESDYDREQVKKDVIKLINDKL